MTLPEVPTPDMVPKIGDRISSTDHVLNGRTISEIVVLGHSVDFGRKPITLRSNSLDNKGK